MPFAAGHHVVLLVVDLRPGISKQEQIRYYETLTTMSEPCLHKAHAILAWLLNNEIVDEDFLMRPPLDRTNASIRQPIGSNLCGWYIMTYLEMEVAMLTGHGPAAIGWPEEAMQAWHARMQKFMPQLQKEIDMKKKEVTNGIALLEKYGQKVMQERKKTYDLACNKMKKGEALTSLQIEAMAIVNENSKLQISDLPAEYHKAIEKLQHYEVGVCSRCRFQSGCLSCSIEKCTAYWMRREGKRLGRSICAEYML